jgi:hypothetical protein
VTSWVALATCSAGRFRYPTTKLTFATPVAITTGRRVLVLPKYRLWHIPNCTKRAIRCSTTTCSRKLWRPGLGLVVSPGLLLQGLFGMNANRARPLSAHTLPAQEAGLTGGCEKHKASALTFSRRPIVVRRQPRRAAHFPLL